MDLPSRGGRAPGSQANGSFPKGTGRLSEKSPAGYPPPHHRDDTPGSAGVPPACCPFGCRSVSLRMLQPAGPPCLGGNQPCFTGSDDLPVRAGAPRLSVKEMAKLWEDLCGRDARAPGWASSHDRVTPTGLNCKSILAPVVGRRSMSSSLFVFIGGHRLKRTPVSPSDDLPGRAGAPLT